MKETRADTRRALLQALALHVVLFGLMFAGLQWTRSNVAEAAQGEVIEADLVDPSALSAAMRSALQREPEAAIRPEPDPLPVEPLPVEEVAPEPLPQPVEEEPALPAPVPEPAPVEQERVQRDADSPQVAKVDREQEEKRRQQALVDLDARQQSEMERQRQQQIAEIRRQRAQARNELKLAEQRARQLADAKAQATGTSAASPPPGNRGTDPALAARYAAALQAAILRNWTRPESVPFGQRCRLVIRQIPGGEVVDVRFEGGCPYDELGRRSVEAAVLKASPLPYAGFEDVFERQLQLNFEARD